MQPSATPAPKRMLHRQNLHAPAKTIDAAITMLEESVSVHQQALAARLIRALSALESGSDEVTATAADGQPTDGMPLLEPLTTRLSWRRGWIRYDFSPRP